MLTLTQVNILNTVFWVPIVFIYGLYNMVTSLKHLKARAISKSKLHVSKFDLSVVVQTI